MNPLNFEFMEALRQQYKNGVEAHAFMGCPLCNARPYADLELDVNNPKDES